MKLNARKILLEKEISLTEAARHCDVSTVFLSRVLNGQKKPSWKVRQGLSRLLKLPQKELFQPINETG